MFKFLHTYPVVSKDLCKQVGLAQFETAIGSEWCLKQLGSQWCLARAYVTRPSLRHRPSPIEGRHRLLTLCPPALGKLGLALLYKLFVTLMYKLFVTSHTTLASCNTPKPQTLLPVPTPALPPWHEAWGSTLLITRSLEQGFVKADATLAKWPNQ